MLRLKASILKAAAHGREKGGGEANRASALPRSAAAWDSLGCSRKAG